MMCIPVIDKNVDDALKSAENALKVADIVEFRVDMLESVDKEDIAKMAKYPSIITIRADWEGGEYTGDNDKRMELYKTAIENNVKFIDIELKEEKNKELVEFRNSINSETKIIVSYHDFEKTPDYGELLQIVKRELEIGDTAKFATMAKSKKDVLNILRIVNEFEGKIIGIGMGEEGKLTRILGVDFGSILTFSSMEGRSSAPGQVDVVKLKKIWELLK